MPEQHPSATVPNNFYCEHTPSKSRVYALVRPPHGPQTLKAVMTCADPDLAQQAASVLSAAWLGGEGPAVRAEAERVLALCPSAPAASLRHTLEHAFTGHWPDPELPALSSALTDDDDPDDEEDEVLAPATLDHFARTPSDARLADLPGKVVRVTTVVEVHVHDPKRLLAAAHTLGWTPFPDEDDTTDPEDVVGAVMTLAESPEIPGADAVSNQMSGHLLRRETVDEVVNRNASPATSTFHNGSQLRKTPAPLHPKETIWGTVPDFAKTFPVSECDCDLEECVTCGSWTLTPRTADIIHSALSSMADFAYDDVKQHANAPVRDTGNANWGFFDQLPRLTWNQTPQWRREVARACDDLAEDLEAGRLPIPRCFAEELILQLVLTEEASGTLEEVQDRDDDEHDSLPTHHDDYDWDACAEELFQDSDILLMYQSGLDGIEEPDAELNRTHGIGDMRPSNWFTPFDNVDPRDADRGFRR